MKTFNVEFHTPEKMKRPEGNYKNLLTSRKEYTDLETELIILGYDLEVINQRLEYLRTELRNECISYGELSELYGLAEYIDPNDMELLEAAGVPEH